MTTPIDASSLPASYVFNTNATAFVCSERFFYDGTRRVQELITHPLLYNKDHDIITMANELYAGRSGNSVCPSRPL